MLSNNNDVAIGATLTSKPPKRVFTGVFQNKRNLAVSGVSKNCVVVYNVIRPELLL